MAQECGEAKKETPILGSGNLERQMGTVSILGLMETDMKENFVSA